jgi:hypothetical protein
MIYRLNKKFRDDGEIRTPIPKAALPPQSSVSTNFTTSPKTVSKITKYLLTCQQFNHIKNIK